MRLDARSGLRGKVVNLDTGLEIPAVRWVELPDVPGAPTDYEAFHLGPDGKKIRLPTGLPSTYKARARVKFVPDKKPDPPKSDQPRREVHEAIKVPLFSNVCCHYACNRVANWSVSDEVPLFPVLAGATFFTRGRVVGRRYYCAWHYKPPRLLDAKGEVMQVFDEAGGVRPQ